jgi:hypothetical protein
VAAAFSGLASRQLAIEAAFFSGFSFRHLVQDAAFPPGLAFFHLAQEIARFPGFARVHLLVCMFRQTLHVERSPSRESLRVLNAVSGFSTLHFEQIFME